MRNCLKVLIILVVSGFSVKAQKDYARKVVDTLASPYMAGRGYVDNGCTKAATYILSQFEEIGLYPFGSNYEQPFHFPISTYPGKVEVKVNGKQMANGDDYIVIPSTPSIKGTYSVVKFDRTILTDSVKLKKFLGKNYSNTFIVIDDTGSTDNKEKELWESMRFNPFKAKGIIILTDKLTQETSDTLLNYALIYALRYNPHKATDCGSAHKSTVHHYGMFLPSEFTNAKKIKVDIENVFIKDFTARNLIGYIKGTVQPDTFIVFSAHYDHLGKMDNIFFPGANDNASGTAMLLSLARYYSKHRQKYSIAFMSFAAEEVNIRGSHYYVQHPLFPLSKIKFLINMDIMGTGDEGITVVNSYLPEYATAYNDIVHINDSLHLLKEIHKRGSTANSDHYFFYKAGVPDFFIYTMGGIKAYHDIYDRRETLPLTDFDNVFKLLIDFTGDICNQRF